MVWLRFFSNSRKNFSQDAKSLNRWTKDNVAPVTIVIPCRNEETNISKLLESLTALSPAAEKIVVVDDRSTDRTFEISKTFPVTVVKGNDAPEGWSGKCWACHQALSHISTPYVLFTDADTVHEPHSLGYAMQVMNDGKLDLVSATPYFLCKSWWEKCSWLFYFMLFLITNFKGSPKYQRLFAIGQYLLFKTSFYHEIGGHQAVRSKLAEDVGLAQECLRRNGNYRVLSETKLYSVNMYDSFKSFINGWTRNFRLGVKESSLLAFVEISLLIHLLMTAIFHSQILFFVGLMMMFIAMSRSGNFPLWSLLTWPFSLFIFMVISLRAMVSNIMGSKIIWKTRKYIYCFLILMNMEIKTMAATVEVNVTHLRSTKGSVVLALHDESRRDKFPDNPNPVKFFEVQPLSPRITLKFEDLAPGTYALSMMHDESGQKKFQTNFLGIPKVGFGFSNNHRVFFGPPSFQKASFQVVGDDNLYLEVQAKYFL